MQSSLASLYDTGVSELHQAAPTPPGRSKRPRPQRSHSPAMMGTDHSMINFSHRIPSSFTQISIPCSPSSQCRHLEGNIRPWGHRYLLSSQGINVTVYSPTTGMWAGRHHLNSEPGIRTSALLSGNSPGVLNCVSHR